MSDERKKQTLAERLYHANILPDGNLQRVDLVESLFLKMRCDLDPDCTLNNEKKGSK